MHIPNSCQRILDTVHVTEIVNNKGEGRICEGESSPNASVEVRWQMLAENTSDILTFLNCNLTALHVNASNGSLLRHTELTTVPAEEEKGSLKSYFERKRLRC